jgi:hypothetical protein
MDPTNVRHIVSKEELQSRMDDTRHPMAERMGEIKHELSEAAEWRTYMRRYPGSCLLAGWRGTGLDPRQSARLLATVSLAAQPHFQPSESATFPRMANKVISTVLAEAKMRRFSNVTTHPAKK